MRYVLLLRGINVGGKHKVSMGELKASIAELGYQDVVTYINSGNVIFDTDDEPETINIKIAKILKRFSFPIHHVVLSREEYLKEASNLPSWWSEPLARKDVLFYTDEVDYEEMISRISAECLSMKRLYILGRKLYFGESTQKKNSSALRTTNYSSKSPFIDSLPYVMTRHLQN